MNQSYSALPIIPPELHNSKWVLIENEREGFGADKAHPWYLDIWSVVIPEEVREKAYFGDKPYLKRERWGLTKSGLIAQACFKASSGLEGSWKVYRLELRSREEAPLTLEGFEFKRRQALNQIEEHFTVYQIDTRVVPKDPKIGKDDAAELQEDEFQELDVIRSIVVDTEVTNKLAQLCPNPDSKIHDPTADGVDAFKYGTPYTKHYSNINDVMIFKEQSWFYQLKMNANLPPPNAQAGPTST
ncbi:hypothetical protein DM02DRAFT_628606 [Periconia macrospinosa]|uniref:Uncharacterized protein n=1 Tax=Periconia macrospinosa TaxID=97972 RepID=A0A2V1DSX1_9PLEO|nr:hypothetical protein DM02DRAFT_628606 [Periconia macrospinosa]